jgi:hypothetical protein
MNRKFFAGIAPLMVVIALAVIPAAAQASPAWFKGKTELTSSPITATTSGVLTFTALGSVIKCKVKDAEELWNPAPGGPGQDLMTAFTLSVCKVKPALSSCAPGSVEVLANGLPWPSHLIPGPPIRDEIQKMRILVRCPGTVGDEFEGSLTPEVAKGALVFGPGSGTLLDPSSNPMTVSGTDKFEALPGKISAK